MVATWVMRFDRDGLAALGAVRLVPHLELLEEAETQTLWLRGPTLADADHERIERLPAAERFVIDPAKPLLLRPSGQLVPTRRLPAGEWRPLAEAVTGSWTLHNAPAVEFSRPTWSLVRGGAPQVPTLLLTDWPTWSTFVATAPLVRLRPLRYVVDEAGRVIVRGQPVPSIRGEAWCEQAGVAIRAGWRTEPALSASLLRRIVAQVQPLADDDLVWLWDASHCDVITADAWVPASRSSVRLTTEVLP